MEQFIRQVGAWLKQGFSMLIDGLVSGFLWSFAEMNRFFSQNWRVIPSDRLVFGVIVAVALIIIMAILFYYLAGRVRGFVKLIVDTLTTLLLGFTGLALLFIGIGAAMRAGSWIMGNLAFVTR
ncbi:hypothetical protein KW798_00135 [Candidatus Parcubacteria bacterium]|nr:hypothetical protein [Candidatus Parcubacteria bacterium]